MNNVKVSHPRAKSCVTQEGAGERITSADGLRWAISKNHKVSIGFGRWDIVKAWNLKQRVAGKVVSVAINVCESAAINFIK